MLNFLKFISDFSQKNFNQKLNISFTVNLFLKWMIVYLIVS